MKILLLFCLLLPGLAHADPFTRTFADESWKSGAENLAIQSGGRVKPLGTFANEGVELLTGHSSFRGKDSLEVLLSLAFEPQAWQEVEFLQLSYLPLKKDLGLADKPYYSPKEFMSNTRLPSLFQELDAKMKTQEKLNPYFQAVQRLANQMGFLQELITGRSLRLAPPDAAGYQKSDAWFGFEQFTDEQKLRFALMAAGFTSDKPEIQAKMNEYVSKFRDSVIANNPKLYPDAVKLKVETHFNHLHPFRWAWMFSLVGAIVLGVSFYSEQKIWYRLGMLFYLICFGFEIYGFGLRCYIAGRPPVTNMYESVIWVSFGCMLFGLILEMIYKKRVIALGALMFATVGLIIADNVSGAVDDSINPLEAVLRSNYWLTIHVMTITLGYAAFGLSMILGNLGLGQWAILGRESKEMPARQLAFFAYRAVQVGVILLAAGTILGGIWADYSWGRFWGWDPKETWALIALLGYLALIHARFSGLVRPFGFLVGCVSAFLGVVMAWYGVNFVLGVGKHSYGFGAGGLNYVLTYCALQFVFIGVAAWQFRQSRRPLAAA